MSNLESRAAAFAAHHHSVVGQLRKYTSEPYIVHPCAVAQKLRPLACATEVMLAAAWLHDVVEDTTATLEDVESAFGAEVAGLVGMLTNPSKGSRENRAARKAQDRAHVAGASPAAKTIKAADRLDNLVTIRAYDPEFARVYVAETRLLLPALVGADAGLVGRLEAVVMIEEDRAITATGGS